MFIEAVDAVLDALFQLLNLLKSRAAQRRLGELGRERLQVVEPRAVHRRETEPEGLAVDRYVCPDNGFRLDAHVVAENQAGSSVAKGSEHLRRHEASLASSLQSGSQWQNRLGVNRLETGRNLGGHNMRGTIPKPPAHGVADEFRCVSLNPMTTARYGDQSVVLIDPIPCVA